MLSRGTRADVGRRCEERSDVNWARWSDIWTAPDSISAVVPAVGLGRAGAAGGERAVEVKMSVDTAVVLSARGAEVEAVAVAVVMAAGRVDEVAE